MPARTRRSALAALVAVGLCLSVLSSLPRAGAATGFVERDGDRLILDGSDFRFVSVNVPNLHVIEDPYPAWHAPDPWEQEDAIASVAQMGGQVIRIYALSVGDSVSETPRHVTAPGVFNEDLFVALDHLLSIAADYDIKVVIPLVDRWSWWGGTAEYAAFRGLPREAFYTDRRVIRDFKLTVRHVVTRVNTVTGLPYHDDPTILAWETGNELDAVPSWTDEIARFIKRLDPNHVVVDGNYGVDPASLDNPAIDVVSNHYYVADPAAEAAADRAASRGKRPLLVGEFGLNSMAAAEALLDEVVDNGTAGALLWSLRFHDRDGGFYHHDEGVGIDGRPYQAYHWPGFASGAGWDETAMLSLLRDQAHAIRGATVPPTEPPTAPTLFPVDDVHDISWQGVAGAASYDLERRSRGTSWTVVASGFDDSVIPNRSLVVDHGTVPGERYAYRLVARNPGGASPPSPASGAVVAPDRIVVDDDLEHLIFPVGSDGDLFFDDTNSPLFGGDDSRLARASTATASITYGETHRVITAFDIETFHWPAGSVTDLEFAVSPDGIDFSPIAVERTEEASDWIRVVYTDSSLPADSTHLRITFPGSNDPPWTPQIGSVTVTFDRFPSADHEGEARAQRR